MVFHQRFGTKTRSRKYTTFRGTYAYVSSDVIENIQLCYRNIGLFTEVFDFELVLIDQELAYRIRRINMLPKAGLLFLVAFLGSQRTGKDNFKFNQSLILFLYKKKCNFICVLEFCVRIGIIQCRVALCPKIFDRV